MKQKQTSGASGKTGEDRAKAILGHAPANESAIPKQWAWHYRALSSLKNQLINESSDLRKEITQSQEESHGEDLLDFSADEFEQDQALSELAAETDALNEVNEAIGRILNGTYGVCEESGKAIPEARLRAIPWTRYTREVKQQMENQEARR